MPSPQSLVAFLVMLLLLLIATRTQLDFSPNISAAISIVLALAFGWVVDRRIPPDEDEAEEEADAAVAEPEEHGT